MTSISPTGGSWLGDPSHRHRLRFRERRWTEWVADGSVPERDPEGLRRIHRRRVLGTIAVVLALVMVGAVVVAMALAEGPDTVDDTSMTAADWRAVRADRVAVHQEFGAWELPATVAATGILERSGRNDPWVDEVRTFAPANGATAAQAVADLQHVLRARGWMFGYFDGHPWSARKQGLDATMQIVVEDGVIQVEIDA